MSDAEWTRVRKRVDVIRTEIVPLVEGEDAWMVSLAAVLEEGGVEGGEEDGTCLELARRFAA
eukprot:1234191-Rhodomonas_salina.1